jgi:hypothetical protein
MTKSVGVVKISRQRRNRRRYDIERAALNPGGGNPRADRRLAAEDAALYPDCRG